jgi:site-specific recombinase XerD
MSSALITQVRVSPALAGDLLAAFGEFLRLNVAEGDASPHTVRSYYSQVAGYVAWCKERGIDPTKTTERDPAKYRRYLVDMDYSRIIRKPNGVRSKAWQKTN